MWMISSWHWQDSSFVKMENSDHAISPTEHLLFLRKKARPFYLWQIRSKLGKNGAGKRKMAKRYRHLFGNSLNFYHLRKPICELLKATFRHKIFPSVVCYHIYEMNIYSTKRNKWYQLLKFYGASFCSSQINVSSHWLKWDRIQSII